MCFEIKWFERATRAKKKTVYVCIRSCSGAPKARKNANAQKTDLRRQYFLKSSGLSARDETKWYMCEYQEL